jgi:probable rRNA maturation factor
VLDLLEPYIDAIGPRDAALLVVVSDDRTLQEHNRDYRGQDRPTDVLSFSYLSEHEPARHELLRGASVRDYCDDRLEGETPLAGQVLISVDAVRERGLRHADDTDGEVLFLITHGALHVLGFDHVQEPQAEEMERIERELFEPLRRALQARRESDVR